MHAMHVSLRSSYCLLRTVVWTLFCFTRSVFIVSSQCFVSWWQFCPLTGGFQVGDLGCSAAFSSIVVLPAEYARTVGSTLIRFSRKELLYRWCLLRVKSIIWSIFIVFFPVLFFVMAILSVNRRVLCFRWVIFWLQSDYLGQTKFLTVPNHQLEIKNHQSET